MDITGPQNGATGLSYRFSAQAGTLTATIPITYTWTATQQSPVTHMGGLSDSVAFTWNDTGTHTLTVTASNSSAVTNTFTIEISAPVLIYLPLVHRN